MTSQYLNHLYSDLLSNSPQTVTIDIPASMGTGQISQIVTKQGAVVSDWKMNYFSDVNVQGVNSEEYIQILFCFKEVFHGVSLIVAKVPVYKRENRAYIVDTVRWNIFAIRGKAIFFLKSNRQIMMRSDIKLPQPFASWSNSL